LRELEAPERKSNHRIEFKGDSGATRAENVSSPVEQLNRRLPSPGHIRRNALRRKHPAPDMGVINLVRDLLGHSHELGDTALAAPARE
jgi:hypothetical protein